MQYLHVSLNLLNFLVYQQNYYKLSQLLLELNDLNPKLGQYRHFGYHDVH